VVLEYLFLERKDQPVSLKQELRMIENYIGLEQLRFGDRLRVSYEVEGNPEGIRIAPLLLYAFVENCFENGAGMDMNTAWINIRLQIQSSRLNFIAENSLPDKIFSSAKNQFDHTLENSVKRLEMLYPNSHRLTIREKDLRHKVELQITLP
jgi:LytS/YehU family sensor histidine kinase